MLFIFIRVVFTLPRLMSELFLEMAMPMNIVFDGAMMVSRNSNFFMWQRIWMGMATVVMIRTMVFRREMDMVWLVMVPPTSYQNDSASS